MLLSISIAFKSNTQGRWTERFSRRRREGAYTTRGGVPKTPLSTNWYKNISRASWPSELETGAGLPDFVKEELDAFPRVVFPPGLVERGDDLLVYYSAADVSVAAARVRKRDRYPDTGGVARRGNQLKQGDVPL